MRVESLGGTCSQNYGGDVPREKRNYTMKRLYMKLATYGLQLILLILLHFFIIELK